jgi:uncharacterized membrane protein affecting hemolysin expression
MIYKGQKLSDNLTQSQRDMFKYLVDRGNSIEDIVRMYFDTEEVNRKLEEKIEDLKRRMIWIIGLLTIITVILGFIAVMIWAIGDKISQK